MDQTVVKKVSRPQLVEEHLDEATSVVDIHNYKVKKHWRKFGVLNDGNMENQGNS